MATAEVNDVLEVSALRERCATLEHELVSKKLAVPDAVAAIMPGGENNPGTTPHAWLRAFEKLLRMHALASSPSASSRSEHTKDDQAIDDVLSASLSGTPVLVSLSDGSTQYVFPKSFHALKWLEHLDANVQLRTQLASATRGDESSIAEHKVAMLVPLVEGLAVRLWLWILTHEAPCIPFTENAKDPEPPDWTLSVPPEDLLRFVRAHHEVNGRRLALLSQSFPADPTPGGAKMSLSGFIGSFAHEKGLNPTDVMRQWSLGAVFASAIVAARSAKLAREAAERRSKN